MKHWFYLFSGLLMNACSVPEVSSTQKLAEEAIRWNAFTPQVFELAKRDEKLVLLHIGAQWCHWCHVMEDSTYADADVQEFLNDHFILAKEDQDSRPDLFTRYRSYGWPAIVVFDASANELLKLRGFQEKKKFLTSLENVIAQPIPLSAESSIGSTDLQNADSLSESQLIQQFIGQIDPEKGSLRTYKKSLYAPSIEMALVYCNQSDSLKNWLQVSIQNSYQLMDQEWGGIFQYATHSDWKNAHFERLLRVQAEHIIHYCKYGARFREPRAIQNAIKIYDYCNTFLSNRPPLFNNSQDADYQKGIESTHYYQLSDAERRKLGTPIVHNVWFLKENAQMSKALVYLWAATSDEKYLVRAEKILNELKRTYKNKNGLYQRSPSDSLLFSLDDNTAMLESLTLAGQISGDHTFIYEARELANSMLLAFSNEQGTLNSVCGAMTLTPNVSGTSNLNTAFAISLCATMLNDSILTKSAHLLSERALNTSADYSAYFIPYRLLRKSYLKEEPLHARMIFEKEGTTEERKMLQYFLLLGPPNLIVERIYSDNLTPDQRLQFGHVSSGTAFLCTSSYCSSPLTSCQEIALALWPEHKKTASPGQRGFSNTVLPN